MKPDPIRIQGPCSKNWEELDGDDRSRFCLDCGLSVHNLEAMTRAEAHDLVTAPKSRVCVRRVSDESGEPIFLDTPQAPARTLPFLDRGPLWLRVAATAIASLVAACRQAPPPSEPALQEPSAPDAQLFEPGQGVNWEALNGLGYACGPEEESPGEPASSSDKTDDS